MTNNNILTPNSEYWKDNAIETFKGNSDLFIDFLQERDRHSAWIETQITDVQFDAMFAEPMYIADDAKKYSIPAEIVQEAANNSKLYGVVRGKHIPVGLAATESLIGYSKLIREGYSWMRRVNPVNLAKAINNGIDTIRYDDRRSTKCLVKVGDEMIRSVVSARYAPMPSGDLFNYINMDYLPENWEKAQFMSGYWTHERVRGMWSLAEYRDTFMKTIGMNELLAGFFPALSVENSDTTASSIKMRPMFIRDDGYEFPLLNKTRTMHIGAETIHERLESDLRMVFANFKDSENMLFELAATPITYGYNTLTHCLKQSKVNMPVEQAREAAQVFFTDKGNGPCTAMDVYMAVCDAYNYVVRDYPEDKLKITRACDAAVSAMQSPWQLLDKDTPANL